jgi:hypothetical protein
MTLDELEVYANALRKLPPVGWVFMGQPKKGAR